MKSVYSNHGYCCDPHGAIGFRALKEYFSDKPEEDYIGVFLETAHPAKFLPTVESTLGESITIPAQLSALIEKEKKAHLIDNDYDHFKQFLKCRR